MFVVLLAPEMATLVGAGACYIGLSNPKVLSDIVETGAKALDLASEHVAKTFASLSSNFTTPITTVGVAAAPALTSIVTSTRTSKLVEGTGAKLAEVAGAELAEATGAKLAEATGAKLAEEAGAKLGEATAEVVAKNVGEHTDKSRLKRWLPYLVGGAVILIAAGAGYYIWSSFAPNPSGERRNALPNPPAHMQDGDDDIDDDDDDDTDYDVTKKDNPLRENTPEMDEEVLISKRLMKKLMDEYGESMYNKLKSALTLTKLGKVWSDPKGRFRIDAGEVLNKHPRVKTWNLQVNRKPPGHEAKKLLQSLGKRGTHEKLLWGVWDFDDPPSYGTWVQLVMALFDD